MAKKLHTTSERVAKALLDIGAVAIAPNNPFTWASGIRAPVYCDNRVALSYPSERHLITDAFITKLDGLTPEAIVGVATGGIPYAALLADRLSLPMAYVRGKPKGYGRRNQIEGHLVAGSRVVVVEDLVSTGMSSIRAVDVVREVTGEKPVAVLAIFMYNLRGVAERFVAHGTTLHSLTDFDTLMQVAFEVRRVRATDLDILKAWQQDPHAWSERHGN